jgi:NitT/TauT family transport system substrate-binding protein
MQSGAMRRAALILATVLLSSWANTAPAAVKEVRIALPFLNGVSYPYFSVAEEMGYAAEEGITFDLKVTQGSAASYQLLVAGQVDFALTQPAQVLNGVARGSDIVSIYTAYQGSPFQFVTPSDSAYRKLTDLKGTKVGISSLAGGQYTYVLAMLKSAGLTVGPGKDIELADVGRGGAAAVALKDKRIAAYSGANTDIMRIEAAGIPLRQFNEGPAAKFFSDSLVAHRAALQKDPKTAIAVGRAIAKATVYCVANVEACWKMVAKRVPDEARDVDFTHRKLIATLALHRLPAEAQGKWGYQRAEAWQAIEQYLLDSGQLEKEVPVTGAFTNRYLDEINEFDSASIEAVARKAH